MLDARRNPGRGELAREPCETWREGAERFNLVRVERKGTAEQVVVALGERLDAQVGHAVRQVVVRMRRFAALELGIAREELEPRLRRVPVRAERHAGVG